MLNQEKLHSLGNDSKFLNVKDEEFVSLTQSTNEEVMIHSPEIERG
jgi:hypothetical protein